MKGLEMGTLLLSVCVIYMVIVLLVVSNVTVLLDSVDTKVDTVRNKGWLTGQVHKVDSRQLCLQLDRHSSLRQDKWYMYYEYSTDIKHL